METLLNNSKLFKKKNRVISERILLAFDINPKNPLDKISHILFEEMYTLMNLLTPKKENYYRFAVAVELILNFI